MVNEQVVRNSESGLRNCPVMSCVRVIDVSDPQVCDLRIMRGSCQVYH